MKLLAIKHEYVRTNHPIVVSVRLDDGNGAAVRAVTFHMRNDTDAQRLVEAINTFAETQAPSAVHWASSRMRSLNQQDRAAVLSIMDEYAGVLDT